MERLAAESFDPPRVGVSNTSLGKAKNPHQAETEPEKTASERRSPHVFANRGRTFFGTRLTKGELSLHKAKKSSSHGCASRPTLISDPGPFLRLDPEPFSLFSEEREEREEKEEEEE